MNFLFQLTSSDWLLLVAVAICLYSTILMPLRKSEAWKKRGVTTWGPIPLAIVIRTTSGLKLLDRMSYPKKLWRIIASAGVPLVILSMAYFLMLLLLMAYVSIRSPPEPSNYNAPRNILLIPGINEYIPFVWGWIAIFVTMVVHEFAHGILSRVEGVTVKSMGLVTLLFAPIAAFVEPDDEELFGTDKKLPIVTKGARIRILAAGVISNFIVAAIAMALFFGPVIGSIAPVDKVVVSDVQNGSFGELAGFENRMVLSEVNAKNVNNLAGLIDALKEGNSKIMVFYNDREVALSMHGVPVRGIMVAAVSEGSPAANVGIPVRTVITEIDGTEISGLNDFRRYINTTRPGQNITITTGSGSTYNLRLATKPDGTSLIGIGISGDAVYIGGVTFQEAPAKQFLAVLRAIPGSGIRGFAAVLSLPFFGIPGFTEKGFPGFSGWIISVFEPTGWAASLGSKFFWIANLLLWVGWINLYAGLFNCLPAVPLDGGHIFRDLVQAGFERVVNVKEAEKLTRTVVAILAWLVLTSLVITVFAPFTHGLSL